MPVPAGETGGNKLQTVVHGLAVPEHNDLQRATKLPAENLAHTRAVLRRVVHINVVQDWTEHQAQIFAGGVQLLTKNKRHHHHSHA
jgi:hypothetical protein